MTTSDLNQNSPVKRKYKEPGMVPASLVPRRLRQEDCHESNIVSSHAGLVSKEGGGIQIKMQPIPPVPWMQACIKKLLNSF